MDYHDILVTRNLRKASVDIATITKKIALHIIQTNELGLTYSVMTTNDTEIDNISIFQRTVNCIMKSKLIF